MVSGQYIPMRSIHTLRWLVVFTALALAAPATVPAAGPGQPPAGAAGSALAASVAELRHIVGRWNVVSEFLGDDGTVAATVRGTYAFEWVVEDKVVRGLSDVPSMKQRAAILFFVNERAATIEMTSVGADGQLWRMIGPLGGDSRTTPDVTMPNGSTLRLRFTRSNVSPDGFESKMERSIDGGRRWVAGNHQVFTRVS